MLVMQPEEHFVLHEATLILGQDVWERQFSYLIRERQYQRTDS